MIALREHRSLYIFESIIFILLGLVAIAAPALFTFSIELVIGALFLVGGLIQGFRSLRANRGSERFFSILGSLCAIVAGTLLLFYPLTGILTLTLIIAAFFFIDGIATAVLAFKVKPAQGWGWLLFSGIIGIILALIIWSELPGSAVWVIGLLVGINLLFFGLTLLSLALGAKK